MIYSNFYNKWIANCMRCGLTLMNVDTSLRNQKEKICKLNFYDYQTLKKYFIINSNMHMVRSDCGYCINKNCKAFMKNQ